ncbi:MAG: tetratricopeptide repeat protein [Deltaproteobacteria bacterium]|nr:tetratricopeptide repeat protein [Deltaproteobacteria bacterium]
MKKILPILAVAVAAGVALSLLDREEPTTWTTDSPEALAELERGLEAMSKFYRGEASHHLQLALEEDPGFAAALVFLARGEYSNSQQQAVFRERLRQVDLSSLQPREEALVRYTLADTDEASRTTETAREILENYLQDHPADPVILQFYCTALLDSRDPQDSDAVEECFRSLIELNPNWVQAQNRLGYLAMAHGRFEEAEERFRTYQYVAPQQANPHDSMGELLLLLGRYEEAESELEQAIALRPDFTASYENLMQLFFYLEDPESAERILDRAIEAGALSEKDRPGKRCLIDFYKAAYELHWEGIWHVSEACSSIRGMSLVEKYRSALWTGRLDEAREIEATVRKAWHEGKTEDDHHAHISPPTYHHMEGVRLAVQGRFNEAIQHFQKADTLLPYMNLPTGTFKLQNRMALADVLELTGQHGRAGEILEAVRQVNPKILLQADYFSVPQIPTSVVETLEESGP